MNIGFFAVRGHPPTFAEIAKVMDRKNMLGEKNKYFFITDEDAHGATVERCLAGSEVDFTTVNIYKEYNPADDYLQYAREYEEEYGVPTLRQYYIADQLLPFRPEKDAFNVICYMINFYKKFFSANKLDYYVSILPGGAFALTTYKLAEKHGVKVLVLQSSRLKKGFLIDHAYLGYGEKFERKYRENLKPGQDFPRAREFCREFRQKKYKPSYFNYFNKFRFSVFQVVRAIWFASKALPYSYERPAIIIRGIILRRLRRLAMKFYDPFESRIPEGEKFIFYALHVQPEAAIDLFAPVFRDQIALIRLIADNLPYGHKLYVKEHPDMLSTRALGYYKEIRRIKNVRLLAPGIESQILIEKSQGVCTITGTVGWEAMIYGKPVIVFGNVFFDIAEGLVFKVTDMNKLPQTIKHILYHFQPDERKLYAFVDALFDVTYPGKFGPPIGPDADVLSPENIELLASALVNEFKNTDKDNKSYAGNVRE